MSDLYATMNFIWLKFQICWSGKQNVITSQILISKSFCNLLFTNWFAKFHHQTILTDSSKKRSSSNVFIRWAIQKKILYSLTIKTLLHKLAMTYSKSNYWYLSTISICLWRLNVHHKDWLTYSGGTDRPGKLCYNFSISNDLTDMVHFPTCIPDCDSHCPIFLHLLSFYFLSFVLKWLSLRWEILIILLSQFPLTVQQTQNRMPRFIA